MNRVFHTAVAGDLSHERCRGWAPASSSAYAAAADQDPSFGAVARWRGAAMCGGGGVTNRCPRCERVMITLGHGELHHCDGCDRYVGAEGESLDGREGRIRRALAEAGDEPRLVNELRSLLRSDSEDELAELIDRHRARIGDWPATAEWPKGTSRDRRQARSEGYRRGSAAARTVRLDGRVWQRSVVAGAITGCFSFVMTVMLLVGLMTYLRGGPLSDAHLPLVLLAGLPVALFVGRIGSRGWKPLPEGDVHVLDWRHGTGELTLCSERGSTQQRLNPRQSSLTVEKFRPAEWTEYRALLWANGSPIQLFCTPVEEEARRVALLVEWELGLGASAHQS